MKPLIQPSPRKTLHLSERSTKDDTCVPSASEDAASLSEKNAMRAGCTDDNRNAKIIAIRHRRGKITQPEIIGAAIDMRKKCFSSSSPSFF
ncbi:MAG TPA: hypothetical protein VGK97_07465 [Spongiibacteraceae bacterium]|jgi:hypothetical protein